MDLEQLLSRLAVALGIGLLIGLERGWKTREATPGSRVAGIRTFALSGLLGGIAGALAKAGTNTLSITTSPVMEVRKPSFPWIAGAESPFAPFSARKPRIFPSSVFAQMTNRSAIGALLIQVFEPLKL